eukprot:7719367-Alexandrium_andersonii.AAC.1
MEDRGSPYPMNEDATHQSGLFRLKVLQDPGGEGNVDLTIAREGRPLVLKALDARARGSSNEPPLQRLPRDLQDTDANLARG